MRGVRRPVVEAWVTDERPFTEDMELRALVPGLVDLQQDPSVREVEARDRLGVVRQLFKRATVGRQREELPRARQVRRDEQRRAVGRPRERVRLTELEQLVERLRQ